MVKKFLNFLNQEIKGLHQAAYLLAFFALTSQILGLVRDRLLAHYFGASGQLDIYYASFRVPDLIFVSIASTVSIFVLIPYLTEKINEGKAKEFISNIFSVFFITILSVALLFFILMPIFADLFFPQFNGIDKSHYILLSRIMLLSPILLGLSNLFASVTQIHKRFFVYSLSPILYNVGIIVGILFLYPRLGLPGLVWGVILGAFMHLLIQIPSVFDSGLLPRIVFNPDFKSFFAVVKNSIPRTIALSLSNVVILILVSFASRVATGSISIFNLSFNLQSVPLSIIGVSYSIAAFPTLANYFTAGDRGKFVSHIIISARHIIFWSIPAIFLFIVLRAQIVRSVLGSGMFGWEETRLTAAALALFSFSILAQSLVLLFVRGYYAAGITKIPLIINTISSMLIVFLSIFLINFYESNIYFRDFFESLLRIEDVSNTTIIMLPLAYSIGMILNAILLWVFFNKYFEEFKLSIKESFFDSLAGSFFMGFTTFQFLKVFAEVFDLNTFLGIFLQGLLAGLIGIMFGILILVLLGNKEIRTAWAVLHQRMWRTRVLGREQENL